MDQRDDTRWWLRGLLFGVVFGPTVGALSASAGGSPTEVWIMAVGAAVIGGGLFGLGSWLMLKPLTQALHAVPPDQRRAAWLAAKAGDAPHESEVRQAALHLAEQRRAWSSSWRFYAVVILYVIGTAAMTLSAIRTGSSFQWIVVVFLAAGAASQLWGRVHWSRRVQVLRLES